MTTTARLVLFADYFQVHVMDEDADDELEWTPEAVADRVAVAEQTVGVGTSVNMNVAVVVEVLDGPAADDSEAFDHVVEAGMEVPSGRIAVLGCTDYLPDAAHFDVPEGPVRVRASRSNLAAVVQPGLPGFDPDVPVEQLRLQIWPAPLAEPAVLKRWSS